jgi:hypothetical protein
MSGFVDAPISATTIATDLIVPYSGTSVAYAGASLKLGVPGTPALYVPSALTQYETGTFDVALAGLDGAVTITVKFSHIGSIVVLVIPLLDDTIQGGSDTTLTTAAIPARLRPTATVVKNGHCVFDSSNATTNVVLQPSGVITIGNEAVVDFKWVKAKTLVYPAFSIVYLL